MSSRPEARQQTPPPTLRERQHEQTRNLILDTLIDQLADDGAFEYSAFELARRAGVSVRTIYRHFPDRDSLFKAMSGRIDERIGMQNVPEVPDDLPRVVKSLFRRFDEEPRLIMAQLTTGAGGQVRSHGRKDRVARMRRIVEMIAPDADDATLTARTAAMSSLLSATTWLRMRNEFGMDGAAAGDAVSWALEKLIAAFAAEHATKRSPRKGKESR